MPASAAVHYRWADIPGETINSTIVRKYITSDRVTVAQFELKQGGIVPRHSHENEQVTMVLSGALQFDVGGQRLTVRAGEVMQLPPGIEHEVHVLADAVVIDVFSPVRQDWIDRTDTYFKR